MKLKELQTYLEACDSFHKCPPFQIDHFVHVIKSIIIIDF